MNSQTQLFSMENDIHEGNDDDSKDIKNNYPINIKDENKRKKRKNQNQLFPNLPYLMKLNLQEKLIMWWMEIL